MKKILFFTVAIMILMACSTEKMNFGQLQDRNGMLYLVNENEPFTGDIVSYANGRVEFEGKVVKGLREGPWTYYYPSGQKKEEGVYKEGMKDGTWKLYQANGTQDSPQVYKYGRMLMSDGTFAETPPQPIDSVAPGETVADPKPNSKTQAASKTETVKEEPRQTVVVWERLRGAAIKYLDGIPYTGAVVKYQRNGIKELEGNFFRGRRTGKWVYYDRVGNLRDIRYY
jgi:uncharacterized protein